MPTCVDPSLVTSKQVPSVEQTHSSVGLLHFTTQAVYDVHYLIRKYLRCIELLHVMLKVWSLQNACNAFHRCRVQHICCNLQLQCFTLGTTLQACKFVVCCPSMQGSTCRHRKQSLCLLSCLSVPHMRLLWHCAASSSPCIKTLETTFKLSKHHSSSFKTVIAATSIETLCPAKSLAVISNNSTATSCC